MKKTVEFNTKFNLGDIEAKGNGNTTITGALTKDTFILGAALTNTGTGADKKLILDGGAGKEDTLEISAAAKDLSDKFIELKGIEVRKIELDTANGDIEVKKIDANKSIKLVSDNGDIEGTFVKSIREYNLTTVIGGDSDLPSESPSDGADLFIQTVRGDADIDFFD